jgi:hypothetical protein
LFDYINDDYGRLCLQMASRCRTDVGFGAVLVDKYGALIGIGRNRLANDEDRKLISHVDYAIHAEQDAAAWALRLGMDIRDGIIYVLGLCLTGRNRGALTVRTEDIFICGKCPHTFMKYNITIMIPHVEGWHPIKPKDAMRIGKELSNKGYWKEFANG